MADALGESMSAKSQTSVRLGPEMATMPSVPSTPRAATAVVPVERPRWGLVAAGCLRRLSPAALAGNPVTLVLFLSILATAALALRALAGSRGLDAGLGLAVVAGLAITLGAILVDETLADGEPRARAAALRRLRRTTLARVLWGTDREGPSTPLASTDLAPGDLVLIEAGEAIPGDGSVVEGAGWVDESALAPARQPVLRGIGAKGGESGRVLYGTRLLSDWLVVRIEVREDESHLARAIARVEGAERRPTPGEQALAGRLAGLTAAVVVATAALLAASLYSLRSTEEGPRLSAAVLAALLAALVPTALGGVLPALGRAGRRRMEEAGIFAASGRAALAAGELDVALVDAATLTEARDGRLADLRRMGVRTVLATGADPFAAASAAADAGIDELLAEATPESELDLILAHQSAGRLVATTGGALCDAPALAQADVGFATSACHEAAREAANLIAADPDPAKLLDAVAVGRGLAAGRRRLAAFATAADLAKCLAVLPVVLAPVWPLLARLDLLRLASPRSAVLAAVALNSASALSLAPLAWRASAPRPAAPNSWPSRLDRAAYALGGAAAALAGLAVAGLALQALGVA